MSPTVGFRAMLAEYYVFQLPIWVVALGVLVALAAVVLLVWVFAGSRRR